VTEQHGNPSAAIGRRTFIGWGGAAALGVVLAGCSDDTGYKSGVATGSDAASVASEPPITSGVEGIARLKAGNARFVSGKPTHPDQSVARRTELAGGQKPFAVILSCVDSRVPPELLFDQGLGDLFVARSAGQVLDDAVQGSIEYGIAELQVPLLVVLGHEKCGAVKATLEAVEKQSPPMGNDIDALVEAVRPAVEKAEADKAPDRLDAAVHNNVVNIVAALGEDPVLAAAVAAGKLTIAGARYDLDTGTVEFL
jgi:carbonic anhydrase